LKSSNENNNDIKQQEPVLTATPKPVIGGLATIKPPTITPIKTSPQPTEQQVKETKIEESSVNNKPIFKSPELKLSVPPPNFAAMGIIKEEKELIYGIDPLPLPTLLSKQQQQQQSNEQQKIEIDNQQQQQQQQSTNSQPQGTGLSTTLSTTTSRGGLATIKPGYQKPTIPPPKSTQPSLFASMGLSTVDSSNEPENNNNQGSPQQPNTPLSPRQQQQQSHQSGLQTIKPPVFEVCFIFNLFF
jgi:hypothetical protein